MCPAVRRLSVLALLTLATPRAQAQDRPKLTAGIGMGMSIDRAAPNPRPDTPIPSFFALGGVGAGLVGGEVRAFANGARGDQITRVTGELVLALRPLAFFRAVDTRYAVRVARTVAIDAGVAYERVSRGIPTAHRPGVVVGGHFEMPIGHATSPKELRLRLGGRKMFGGKVTIADNQVGNSAYELFGMLVVVF